MHKSEAARRQAPGRVRDVDGKERGGGGGGGGWWCKSALEFMGRKGAFEDTS